MDHIKKTIRLNEDQKDLLITLVDNGHKLSCDLLVNYWQPSWKECPLCGAKEDNEGIVIHEEQQ